MRPPRIYIAGPFRGATEYDRRRNVSAAEWLALRVARLGAFVRCPHTMTAHFEGQCTDAYWLASGMDMLAECSALALVEGHEAYLRPDKPWASRGTIAEVQEAVRRGIPVLRSEAEVRLFVEEWSFGRDPLLPCEAWEPGIPSGDCETDGHYRCRECARMTPDHPSLATATQPEPPAKASSCFSGRPAVASKYVRPPSEERKTPRVVPMKYVRPAPLLRRSVATPRTRPSRRSA